jgi:hypothetical protein
MTGREMTGLIGVGALLLGWVLMQIAHTHHSVEEWLSRFPGPVQLRASLKNHIFLALTGLALTAAYAAAVVTGDPHRVLDWVGFGFFGLGAILSIITTLPGATGLILDQNGFSKRFMFRQMSSSRWDDVAGFKVITESPGNYSFFAYNDARWEKKFGISRFGTKVLGYNALFEDTYGMSPKELADLMTQWQQRALAQEHGA